MLLPDARVSQTEEDQEPERQGPPPVAVLHHSGQVGGGEGAWSGQRTHHARCRHVPPKVACSMGHTSNTRMCCDAVQPRIGYKRSIRAGCYNCLYGAACMAVYPRELAPGAQPTQQLRVGVDLQQYAARHLAQEHAAHQLLKQVLTWERGPRGVCGKGVSRSAGGRYGPSKI